MLICLVAALRGRRWRGLSSSAAAAAMTSEEAMKQFADESACVSASNTGTRRLVEAPRSPLWPFSIITRSQSANNLSSNAIGNEAALRHHSPNVEGVRAQKTTHFRILDSS